ncbi:unnamed protein product [Amoebophrya sp. A25]|nr:unnamed protein product [Amoebophrya sp. A25]|eukprot:GSA25T00016868001.1
MLRLENDVETLNMELEQQRRKGQEIDLTGGVGTPFQHAPGISADSPATASTKDQTPADDHEAMVRQYQRKVSDLEEEIQRGKDRLAKAETDFETAKGQLEAEYLAKMQALQQITTARTHSLDEQPPSSTATDPRAHAENDINIDNGLEQPQATRNASTSSRKSGAFALLDEDSSATPSQASTLRTNTPREAGHGAVAGEDNYVFGASSRDVQDLMFQEEISQKQRQIIDLQVQTQELRNELHEKEETLRENEATYMTELQELIQKNAADRSAIEREFEAKIGLLTSNVKIKSDEIEQAEERLFKQSEEIVKLKLSLEEAKEALGKESFMVGDALSMTVDESSILMSRMTRGGNNKTGNSFLGGGGALYPPSGEGEQAATRIEAGVLGGDPVPQVQIISATDDAEGGTESSEVRKGTSNDVLESSQPISSQRSKEMNGGSPDIVSSGTPTSGGKASSVQGSGRKFLSIDTGAAGPRFRPPPRPLGSPRSAGPSPRTPKYNADRLAFERMCADMGIVTSRSASPAHSARPVGIAEDDVLLTSGPGIGLDTTDDPMTQHLLGATAASSSTRPRGAEEGETGVSTHVKTQEDGGIAGGLADSSGASSPLLWYYYKKNSLTQGSAVCGPFLKEEMYNRDTMVKTSRHGTTWVPLTTVFPATESYQNAFKSDTQDAMSVELGAAAAELVSSSAESASGGPSNAALLDPRADLISESSVTEIGQAFQQIEVLEKRVLAQNAALVQAKRVVAQHEERIRQKNMELSTVGAKLQQSKEVQRNSVDYAGGNKLLDDSVHTSTDEGSLSSSSILSEASSDEVLQMFVSTQAKLEKIIAEDASCPEDEARVMLLGDVIAALKTKLAMSGQPVPLDDRSTGPNHDAGVANTSPHDEEDVASPML